MPISKTRQTAPGRKAPAELIAYLESVNEPHILIDADYRIAAANSAYRQRIGGGSAVVGRTCYAVSHGYERPCDEAGESCPMVEARRSGRRERVLHLHHTPQGKSYVDIELVPLRGANGRTEWFVEKMEPLHTAHGEPSANGLIGRSTAFRGMLELVARVAPSMASVLLLGETGTGKELVARAVHESSARASRPLVAVDCVSLPETLFEAELFGHEKGAFTGAHAARAGLVEAADGGTLFLDEVGDIPLAQQVKLLRLLESGTYRRVGGTELRRADVRLVSATHRDLAAMVSDGAFRADFFHRLGTFPIVLPPLRARRGDIALLAEALMARQPYARGRRLDAGALARLARHDFPGNVRELRNVLERAALLCDDRVIGAEAIERALTLDVPAHPATTARASASIAAGRRGLASPGGGDSSRNAGHDPPRRPLREAEGEALRTALAGHRGNRRELARALGISPRTLYRKLKALDEDA